MIKCLTLGASDVRFPMRGITVVPESAPVTVAEVVDTLRPEEWYIVESESELIVLSSPIGVVSVEPLTGPMVFRGRFAGGDGQVETRKFAGPYLYAVTAETTGKAELMVGVSPVVSADQFKRITLTVQGARPPPDPEPDPEPEPEPIPTVANVSVAIIEDTMNRSPDTAILMNGLVAWTEFVDAGNDWRAYDLKTPEARGKQAITDLNGPVPGIVIYEKSTRKMIHRGDLPATFTDLKALIGRLTGG
jgi:hypothetical protein